MGKKKAIWKSGDLFGVPLQNGKLCLGQVLGQMGGFVNVVNCAFFDILFDQAGDPPSPDLNRLVASLSTTRDLLDRGYWVVVGHAPVTIAKRKWPNEQFAWGGYVSAKTYGSGNIKHFLEAFYGFEPWDAYKDPNYFDKLLISPSKRPPDDQLRFVKLGIAD